MINNISILFGRLLHKVAHKLIKKYYPKIQITGAEQIPEDGPVLFCANHPNSLIDPILIGVTAKRPVSFMAKAPLFNTPIIGPIMRALGMVPAYRGRDDSSQVKKNQKSLGRVVKGLASGRAMGIFPEGVSTDLRQLGLVRGGASRIALQALEQGVEDLVIIPLGINYERKERLGSKVWINVGEPIALKEFARENKSEQDKQPSEDKVLRRKLTGAIESHLKDVIVHLDNADWDPLLDDLETLIDHSKHKASLKVPKLIRRKRIADALNYFYQEEPETGEKVVNQIRAYHQTVRSAGLVIDDPILQRGSLKTTFKILGKILHLIVWFIPAIVGTLGNIVPFVITRAIAGKIQHQGMKTTAQARIGVGIPIYLLWYTLITATVYVETKQIVLNTVSNFLLILSGTISLKYWPYFTRTMVHLGHQFRASLQRNRLKQLRDKLQEIRSTLVQYAERYAQVVPRPNPPSIKPLLMLFASTVSSILLLSVAFVFYMLVVQHFTSPVNQELQSARSILVNLTHEELNERIESAEQDVLRIRDKARDTHAHSLNLLEEYEAGQFQLENQDNRREVSALLHSFYQSRDDLLKIIATYNPAHGADNLTSATRQRRALLFTAAMLLRHQMSLQFATTYQADKTLQKYLNEPDDAYGIPANLITKVNDELIDSQYKEMVYTAYQQFEDDNAQTEVTDFLHSDDLRQLIAAANQTIESLPNYALHEDLKTALNQAKRTSVNTYLKLQQVVATRIGDFRIKNTDEVKNHQIDPEYVKEFQKTLRPGDILIERRDWYSSNAFLPGYWPHAALYVGTPAEIKERGILKDVCYELERMAAEEKSMETAATEVINGKTHADRMMELVQTLKEDGDDKLNSHHVIEAISEGVMHTTIDHSVGEASSVFALRPRVDEKDCAEAIASAFFYEGRQYDFNFDFDTPNTLVCTEVIYRCYGGNGKNAKLNFPIVELMGRRTLPAHEIARQFIADVRAGKEPQYDLVAWLDTDRLNKLQPASLEIYDGDHTGENFERFANTLNRSSITFMMEYQRHGLTAVVGTWVLILFYLAVITSLGYALTKFLLFLRTKSNSPDPA